MSEKVFRENQDLKMDLVTKSNPESSGESKMSEKPKKPEGMMVSKFLRAPFSVGVIYLSF